MGACNSTEYHADQSEVSYPLESLPKRFNPFYEQNNQETN
jgi:hypothetical protein